METYSRNTVLAIDAQRIDDSMERHYYVSNADTSLDSQREPLIGSECRNWSDQNTKQIGTIILLNLEC
jgi:hypothetical protein